MSCTTRITQIPPGERFLKSRAIQILLRKHDLDLVDHINQE